ncbi:MAG TPA: DUF1810 domain-containing protein [Steroidobacteraceae bacterium]
MSSRDRYDLERFLDAQREIYDQVLTELRLGRKRSHWMWYVFPQITGLGSSAMAQRYAISSLDEAKVYFAHPVLGDRLLECTRLVTAAHAQSVEDVLGYPDNLKLHSSMTLFAHAANHHEVFESALRKYFRSEYDHPTMERLELPWPT